MKLWQHDETGRMTSAAESPGPRWAEVSPAREDTLDAMRRSDLPWWEYWAQQPEGRE